MDPSFDAQAYLSALTNDPRIFKGRLAAGGNALGMTRPTSELLQEHLYPGRPTDLQSESQADLKAETEHEVELERSDTLPWQEGLPPEDAQHRIALMQTHSRSQVRGQRIARAPSSSEEDEIRRMHSGAMQHAGDIEWCSGRAAQPLFQGARERSRVCACPDGIKSTATVTELLLSFDSGVRLARMLADANVVPPPPRPAPLMLGKSRPCPCSLMGPTVWSAFISHLLSSRSAFDASMHPSQLSDAEQYVHRVHVQFRNAVLACRSERNRLRAHQAFMEMHPQAIARGITEPDRTQHPGAERQQIRTAQQQKTQRLAAARAPRAKDRMSPSREDREQDAELRWQTQILQRKFTRNQRHARGVISQ